MLEIKDNPCLPASRELFDCNLMIGHGFDPRINGMAVWVEGLAGHCGSQVRRIEQCTVCLLYTSPSPRDGLLSRMPSSA